MEPSMLAAGFLHLLVSQLGARLVTFGLNLVVARHLTPEAYGLSSIQFHLIISTIMMLSREGFRRGCMRFTSDDKKDKRVDPWRVLSVAWLVLPVGAIVTSCVCGTVLYMHAAGGGDSQQPAEMAGYRQAVVLHGVAAMIELASEPFYIMAAVNLQFSQRVVMDSLPLAVRSLVTLMLLGSGSSGAAVGAGGGGVASAAVRAALALVPPRLRGLPPALAFSVAQLSLALVTLAGYVVVGWRVLRQHQPRGGAAGGAASAAAAPRRLMLPSWGPVEKEVVATSGVFAMQAAAKLVLAEGSKGVMAGLQSSHAQGVYGLVTNLGSLVVRTLFSPLEEVAFAAFSRGRVEAGDRSGLQQQHALLTALTRGVLLVATLGVTFGPAYSYTLVRLVYGSKWSETEAPAVLAVFCGYLLLLGLNGVTEAFVHSTLDKAGLSASNLLMAAFTAAHLAACVLLAPYGATGLVAADSLNMALRIAASAWFIRRHFRALPSFRLASLLPSRGTAAAAACTFAATGASEALLLRRQPAWARAFAAATATAAAAAPAGQRAFLRAAAPHVAVGMVALAALALVLRRTERATLQQLRALQRRKGGAAAADQQQQKQQADGSRSDNARGGPAAEGTCGVTEGQSPADAVKAAGLAGGSGGAEGARQRKRSAMAATENRRA